MPLTTSNYSGDGITAVKVDTYIQLPDSGTVVNVQGSVTAPGSVPATITGSPLAMPAAPGSGSTYWNIQVDTGTGVATVQQSASADPPPISATAVVIFRQTLVPSSTDPALVGSATPDDW